jgi:hypothetical protein
MRRVGLGNRRVQCGRRREHMAVPHMRGEMSIRELCSFPRDPLVSVVVVVLCVPSTYTCAFRPFNLPVPVTVFVIFTVVIVVVEEITINIPKVD